MHERGPGVCGAREVVVAEDDAVGWAEPTSDGLVAGLDADEGAGDGAAGLFGSSFLFVCLFVFGGNGRRMRKRKKDRVGFLFFSSISASSSNRTKTLSYLVELLHHELDGRIALDGVVDVALAVLLRRAREFRGRGRRGGLGRVGRRLPRRRRRRRGRRHRKKKTRK